MGILGLPIAYKAAAVFVLIAGIAIYADRSAVARYESAALAKANEVKTKSMELIMSKSKEEKNKLQTALQKSRKRIARYLKRSGIKIQPKSSQCLPGCIPQWP